jgi:hypothetical protein
VQPFNRFPLARARNRLQVAIYFLLGRFDRTANMSTTIKLLLCGFLFAGLVSRVAAEAEFDSYYDGKRYQFKITEAQQARSPKWDPDKDANPPHPAANALAEAQKFIASIPTFKETFWKLEDLALVNVSGGWAWRARYRLTRRGGSTGIWPTMDCWIVMDGARVEPTITEDKKR